MKLAMFRVDTLVGPFDRFGIVTLDGDPHETVENARDNSGSISGATDLITCPK